MKLTEMSCPVCGEQIEYRKQQKPPLKPISKQQPQKQFKSGSRNEFLGKVTQKKEQSKQARSFKPEHAKPAAKSKSTVTTAKVPAKKPIPVCPLCGEKHNFIYTGSTSVDTKYKQSTYENKRYQIMKCQKCGGKFVIKPNGISEALVGYVV